MDTNRPARAPITASNLNLSAPTYVNISTIDDSASILVYGTIKVTIKAINE